MTKAKLGSGARFKALKKKLASQGATSPGGLAAYIGRKKYGNKKMASMAAKGRKRHSSHSSSGGSSGYAGMGKVQWA